MNIKDVIGTLVLNLPDYTDKFTEVLTATISKSYVLSARKVKIETVTDHLLTNGKKIIVKNVKVKNQINSITIDGDVAIIELKAEHDYTNEEDDQYIEIDGANRAEWNGSFLIENVASKTLIEITKPSATIPSTKGQIWEARDLGGGGIVEVSNVTAKTFEYSINASNPNLPVTDTNSVKGLSVITGVRVTGCADPERAIEIFTKTKGDKKTWAFVMFGDESVAKDSNTPTEAQAQFVSGEESRQTVMVNFDVCVIQPCTELGALEEVQNACGEIRNALIKSLVGVKSLETEADICFKTVYVGSVMNTYDPATYIRIYSFQTPFDITFRQTAENYPLTVALRQAVFKLAIGGEDALKIEGSSEIQ